MAPAPVSVTFPFLVSTPNDAAVLRSVQEALAASCARYLREAGYFADQEEEPLLEAYRDRTVICALDDPGLAALFQRTIVLGDGRLSADGPPAGMEPAPVHAAVG